MAAIAVVIWLIAFWIGGVRTSAEVPSGDIVGAGYSSDSQRITPQKCYNATMSYSADRHSVAELSAAVTFSEMENKFGTSVSASGKYGMFAADAKAHYMKSIKDTAHSISLSYYLYSTEVVSVQIGGVGDQALSESGKGFYNGGNNPLFGLICGDHYIASYHQGALLTMGLTINLGSSVSKETFNSKAGASYGDIASASATINTVATANNITGSVVIKAFQMGGEPNRLSSILNKDGSGNYYALACSLSAMDNCLKTASGLLDYAKEDFANQFSYKTHEGLTPLGVAFSEHYPIERIGLTPPASLVTQEVLQLRDELATKLKENEYYQQKLYPFLNNGYPVNLESVFLRGANSLFSETKRNVRVLMDQHEGAVGCFNYPERCKSIKVKIDSKLRDITIEDLKFLEPIKYVMPIADVAGAYLYSTGDGSTNASWAISFSERLPVTVYAWWYRYIPVTSANLTDSQCSYCSYWRPSTRMSELNFNIGNSLIWKGCFMGQTTGQYLSSGGLKCVGTWCTPDGKICEPSTSYVKHLSPFFFGLYSTVNYDDD